MRYEFTFVVEGVDPDHDDAVVRLTEHLDAVLARGAGVNLLIVAAEGSDAIYAARDAVLAVRSHVPQVVFHHVDRDLVGISEIASRTGRSRQNVTQWVSGERHEEAGPFPQVEGVVGRARVWLWGEVNVWLQQIGLGDDTATPTRGEITDIDYMLQHDRLLTLDRPAGRLPYQVAYVGGGENTTVTYSGYEAAAAWTGILAIQIPELPVSHGSARRASQAHNFVSAEVAQ